MTWMNKEAHPRSRGEHLANVDAVDSAAGSSPLTRGARGVRHQCPDCVGLIPAHAGSTRARPCRYGPGWAHPRSRGEHGGAM